MLILICGLPRAGKTTYSKQFENDYKIIHTDNYDTIDKAIAQIGDLDNVVIEGVFNSFLQRKAIIQAYKGNKTKCIWLNTPKEIREKREHYSHLTDRKFNPPTYDEGWDEIIII